MPNTRRPDDGMPDFSGVTGGASTTARTNTVVYETYTVKAGDTLSKIAKKKYGNANHWRIIHEANKDRIKNPDQIQVGWDIKLPAKPE